MKARGDSPHDRIPGSARRSVPIWLGLMAPPIAALLHVVAGYPIEHSACAMHTLVPFHVFTVCLLAVVGVAGLASRKEWRRRGSENPGDGPPPDGARRLMALMGVLGAVLFAFIIVVQWLPTTLLPPCVRT